MDFEKLANAVKKFQSKNIHQHLDLIVDYLEDYFSFRKSFDDVFQLRPEKLQVGFKTFKRIRSRKCCRTWICI